MTCRIADNKPLRKLTADLGLPHKCHSLRGHCIQSLQRRESGDYAMCSPGAVMGYCQGLFNRGSGTPEDHTTHVIQKLEEIGAPHSRSHELLWNLRQANESPGDYVLSAMKPLLGKGRVPVIITDYNSRRNSKEVEAIFNASPHVYEGETMLVRLALDSESVGSAGKMVNDLVGQARQSGKMPSMWPLFQGDLSLQEWNQLRLSVGADWDYVNIAVTPYTSESVLDRLADQITVAQFLVGQTRGISKNGDVTLHPESCLGTQHLNKSYNIFDYAEKLGERRILPTSIICGPSLQEWTDFDNQERLIAYLNQYKKATEQLWPRLEESTRKEVLAFPA